MIFEERLVREFTARFEEQIEEARDELPHEVRLGSEIALTQAAMGYISDTGAAASDDLCPHEDVDGRGRCKVIAYSLDEDEAVLVLITAIYRHPEVAEGPQTLSRDDVEKGCHRAARFFAYAATNNMSRFAGNEPALAAAREIRSKLDRIDTVQVTLVTNALVRDRSVASMEQGQHAIHFEVWDVERLQRAANDVVGRERIEVDFGRLMGGPLSVLELNPPAREYGTFLAIVPAEVLAKLYEEYGARLFEFNVRSYLQATGKVNKGIRATLADDSERERFLAYNNGITATADEVDVGQEHGRTVIRSLRGLQIVNGAQTTASIHRAYKQEKVDLRRVAVAMKLTQVEPGKLGEFVPLISRFANTQNPVQAADLSANSPFHIRLEQLSEELWCPGEESRWFYERARGAYQVARNRYGTTKTKRAEFDAECPKAQRFGKTELAKSWMAWWGLPHIVARGSQKNYTAFMSELQRRHGADWSPDDAFLRSTAALRIIWQAAQNACKKALITSYTANVVALMVAFLGEHYRDKFDLERVWDDQSVSQELDEVFREWAQLVHAVLRKGAGQDNVTEFAKKEPSWDAVRKTSLLWPEAGIPETVVDEQATPLEDEHDVEEVSVTPDPATPSRQGVDAEVDECMAVDGPSWATVLQWASTSRQVASYDLRVTVTVVQQALGGFQRPVTRKQAPFALRVLRAARAAGILVKKAAA